MRKRYQVIIVGGGPVGAALAVNLGLRGVSCALVESRPGLSRIPKGQNLTQRSVEHFQFWGIAQELRAARIMPSGYPIGEVTAYGNLMSEYWTAPKGRELVRDYYSQANERLPQYCMEDVLRKKMATLETVESRFGWSAKEVEQDDNGVRVHIAESGGTGHDVLEADYLVGCDGARSLVRGQAGIASRGPDFDQLMVLAVFRSRELHEGLKRFPERSTYRVMHPDLKGYWQFFGRIDVGEGWFFHAPVPADADKENFDFHALIESVAGFKCACEFDYVGFWNLRAAVAEKYQVGRIFIAGDAAHSHPPYGGFGLNNGLEDSVNLGWKLAARLSGWGGDDLLRSYSEERQPVFKTIAEDFIAARIQRDSAFLARHSPLHDRREFAQAWDAFANDVGWRVNNYEPNYECSSVIFGPPGGVCSAHGAHMFKARAGHHLAPLPLSSGGNVFGRLGQGFTLLAIGADTHAIASFEAAAKRMGIPLATVRDTCKDGREKYEARLILIRPDQFVAWTGDEAPVDAEAVFAKVTGHT